MAQVKISELPEATLPLTGTERLVIVQDGETRQVRLSDVHAALPEETFLLQN